MYVSDAGRNGEKIGEEAVDSAHIRITGPPVREAEPVVTILKVC